VTCRVTQRLGYIADLGVDAIWHSPFFTSPMVDMGYDVADHRDVDLTFGTLADFDALVAKAHYLGLRVIIDQVLSHSSDHHPFFTESRAARSNPRADWYLWRDAKPDGSPPNNWQSVFGGPGWEWDVRRRQFYYHSFLEEQPDFDFNNPQVQEWALQTLGFWLDRGADGFRLDAINFCAQDIALRDNPPVDAEAYQTAIKTFDMQRTIYSKNQPAALSFSEKMRALVDCHGEHVLIGEIGEAHHPAELLVDYTKGDQRLHTAYNTALMGDVLTPAHVKAAIEAIVIPGGAPTWAFSSHDDRRHVSRWAAYGADHSSLARLTCALLLCLPGAICLYQGEELGLTQTELDYDELIDPEGKTFWPDNPGRDGCRTPMPWERNAPHAGFSNADKTWLPMKAPQANRAADTQIDDPDSTLGFYRNMLTLRRQQPDLRHAPIAFEDAPEHILRFRRGEMICTFNLSADQSATLTQAVAGPVLLSQNTDITDSGLTLGPSGFIIQTVQ